MRAHRRPRADGVAHVDLSQTDRAVDDVVARISGGGQGTAGHCLGLDPIRLPSACLGVRHRGCR